MLERYVVPLDTDTTKEEKLGRLSPRRVQLKTTRRNLGLQA